MNTSDRPSSKKKRSLFSRLNLYFPWLKLVAVCFIGIVAILDLLDLTISKTDNLNDDFPVAPMSKHKKITARNPENKKIVALTFDDGPLPSTTPRLLDILTEKDCVATFFALGSMARKYPEIIKRAQNEGHEIASHTMYHQNLARISPEDAESDRDEAIDTLRSILGRSPTLTRPPYGIFNDSVIELSESPLILWSVDPEDWKNRDVGAIVDIIMSQVSDGAIILMHDIYQSSVDAVPTIIDKLRSAGYEFVTISEMAKIRNIIPSSGNSYYYFKP